MKYIEKECVRSILPDNFEVDAQSIIEEIAKLPQGEYSSGINRKCRVWQDLKDRLADIRKRKCWYCDSVQDRSDNAVDHFRPKNRVAECEDHCGYWWLAFSWENFRYTCTFCNSRRVDQDGGTKGGKHDHFPLWDESKRCKDRTADLQQEQPMLLDPCEEDDPEHLWFNEDGSPASNPSICGTGSNFANERVSVSIRLYHLDHVDLVERRAALCKAIRKDAQDGDSMLIEWQQKGNVTAKKSFRMMVERLQERIHVNHDLAATALCMLEGLRESSPTAYAALRKSLN